MIHKIVAILDRKAEAFLKPIFVQSDGSAVRSFTDAVNDPSTEFSKHPEDYSMWSLGEFNDATGVFIADPLNNKLLVEGFALLCCSPANDDMISRQDLL